MLLFAAVLASLVGVALGLLGGGGSLLAIPIFRYVLRLSPHQAIAGSLLTVFATSIAALVPHARRGCVSFRIGASFGVSGMAGAFLAGRLSHHIPGGVLLGGLAVLMFATAFAMLRGRAPEARVSTGVASPLKIAVQGFVVGGVTGLFGAGGGFVIVPALVLLVRLPMARAVGTSLVVIAMNAAAGFAGLVGHVAIDWVSVLVLAVIAVLGSVAGSALASQLSAARLKTGFGWFVLAMGCFMLAQELGPLLSSAAARGPWRGATTAIALGARSAG